MTDSQKKTIETYQSLMNANATIQTFVVARKIGLFEELSNGQKTAQEIAEAFGLAERPTELLLNQLCQSGYIERYGDHYALSVLGKMLPDEFADLGNHYWAHLEDWLKSGTRLEDHDKHLDQTAFGVEAQALEWMATPNALDLIKILNIGDSRQGMRVIDLFCGSAVFSSAFAYHDQKMKVTLVDQTRNLERAKQTAESIEISSRCDFVEADPAVYQAKFPADMVILANRLMQFDNKSLQSLLRNIAKQLHRQGEIVIVDDFCETESAGMGYHTQALLTEMRTPRGVHRSKREITDMLYECGFVDAMYSDLKSAPGTKGVIVAGISES